MQVTTSLNVHFVSKTNILTLHILPGSHVIISKVVIGMEILYKYKAYNEYFKDCINISLTHRLYASMCMFI